MQNAHDNATDILPQVYENYVAVISTLGPRTLLKALAPLYHPTTPDAIPLVRFVRDMPHNSFEKWTEAKREKFMRAGFDALRILQDTRKLDDCTFLARFMQQHLEEKRDAETATRNGYHVSSKEKHLLNSLDLAFS
jgi:hypothetical protein